MAAWLGPLLPGTAFAQKKIRIIHADSIIGSNTKGRAIQKILGHVHLRNKNIDMYADSAYKFSGQDKVKAFGNIEIDTEEEQIWADTLTYFTDIDFSQLRGRVVLESDSTTLFGNSVDYRFTNKVAHFLDKIRLEDTQGVLKANSGFYFRKADSATFRGDVQLRDSLKYIEGDRLFSNRKKKYYELHNRVFADDPANDSKLMGDYLEADSTGRRLVKGHAWLINYKQDSTSADTANKPVSPVDSLHRRVVPDSLQPHAPKLPHRKMTDDSLQINDEQEPAQDSLRRTLPPTALAPPDSLQTSPPDTSRSSQADTTHIHAARILSIENRMPNDTTTTVKAYQNVRIWSTNFSSVSDSSEYQSDEQTFQLWGSAKAWHKQIQLSGPYIWVKLKDGDIKQLNSYPNPFTVQQDTAIDRLNQIKGDTLNAYFTDGNLKRMHVAPNSHILRFTQKKNQPDGVIELRAPVTNIFFEAGALVKLKSLGGKDLVDGHYLPESEEVAKKKLEGFTWNPDLRPQRPKQKMQRRLEPIPEKRPFPLPKRYLEHIGKSQTDSARADRSNRTP